MKRFITGFVSGALAFGVTNVVSHFFRSSPSDGIQIYGFPFVVLMRGGLAGADEFSILALWADIGLAVLCGVAVGALFVKRVAHEVA